MTLLHLFPFPRRWSSVCSGLLGLGLLSGCSHPSASPAAIGQAPATGPTTLLVAVDRSESTRPLRRQFLTQLDKVAEDAIVQRIPLDVWAYDRSALRLYGPRLPQSKEELDEIKHADLSPNDAHLRTITRPAVLLEALEQDESLHPTHGVSALILTDGDAEVADDEPRLVAAAQALGKDPTFHLAVLDIKPEDRKMWDNALTKGMPGRYVLAGQAEADTALTQFVQGKMQQ